VVLRRDPGLPVESSKLSSLRGDTRWNHVDTVPFSISPICCMFAIPLER
jgi:hypothetical protein